MNPPGKNLPGKNLPGKLLICAIICAIVMLLLISAVQSAKVDKDLLQMGDDNQEKVIIILKDAAVQDVHRASGKDESLSALKDKRSMIKGQQDKFLAKHDLKIKNRYSTVNAFSAKLTKREIAELSDDPDIESIYIDQPVQAMLDFSIPQINANDAWALRYNGMNITGAGETICIVDTGIDYTHPALGGCSPVRVALNGTNVSYALESAHNYADNFNYTWKVNVTGFERIAVHFRNLSTEANYDYIRILDNNSRLIGIFSGKHDDIWTPYSEGDTIYVQLTSDESVNAYGFYIDYVINGTTNTTYDWSNCSKVIGGWDIYNGDGDPKDDNGHGTHCAGIAASTNATYRGVAPGASLIAIKALNSGGGGFTSDIIAGIDWCTNRSSDFNISVISMSLGCNGEACTHYQTYCNTIAEASAINSAVGVGITVVSAAGNQGWTNGIIAPACVQNATPIGGLNDAEVRYGNRGLLLNIIAPAVNIISTYTGGGFSSLTGTSMATPHAAGAAALMQQFAKLQNGSALSPQTVEDVMNASGKQVYDADTLRNYSMLDVLAAINALDSVAPIITFVPPTPVNLTVITTSSFIVNISSNEVLSTALLQINSSNRTMIRYSATSWYYNYSDGVTTYNFTVFGNDSAGRWGASETRFIALGNHTPNITSVQPVGNATMFENSSFIFNQTSVDPNLEQLYYFWYLDAILMNTTANWTYLSDFNSAGSHNVTLIVTDNFFNSSHIWNLTIINVNRAPSIASRYPSSANVIVQEPNNQTFNITKLDPDSDPVVTTWYQNNLLAASVTDNLTFLGNYSSAGTYNITVIVSDGSLTGRFEWNFTVNQTNIAPVLTIISNITVNESYVANAVGHFNATDFDNDSLSFTFGTPFNSSGQWRTNNQSSGNYSATITVSDGNTTDSETIRIFVLEMSDFDNDGFYNTTDCNDTNSSIWQNLTGYPDLDSDGYGNGSNTTVCSGVHLASGYSTLNTDCNNTDSSINPGASDICGNGIDEDCSGSDAACGGGGGGGGSGGSSSRDIETPVVTPPVRPILLPPKITPSVPVDQGSDAPEDNRGNAGSIDSAPSEQKEGQKGESLNIPTAGFAFFTGGNGTAARMMSSIAGVFKSDAVKISVIVVISVIILALFSVLFIRSRKIKGFMRSLSEPDGHKDSGKKQTIFLTLVLSFVVMSAVFSTLFMLNPTSMQWLLQITGMVSVQSCPQDNSTAWNIPVMTIAYFPVYTDNDTLNHHIVGGETGGWTLTFMRNRISSYNPLISAALTQGSTYHGYKDPCASPSLNYLIFEHKEYLTDLPKKEYAGSSITDGNPRTGYWHLEYPVENSTLYIDMKENKTLNNFTIYFWYIDRPDQFYIDISPNGSFSGEETTAVNETNGRTGYSQWPPNPSIEYMVYNFSAISGRYIKLHIQKYSNVVNDSSGTQINLRDITSNQNLSNATVNITKGVLYTANAYNETDHMVMLNSSGFDICDYVDNGSVKEVWVYMYHNGPIAPVESYQISPDGTGLGNGYIDLPVCNRTYMVSDYNYGREIGTMLENHAHHLEVLWETMNYTFFVEKFIGSFASNVTYRRCGWTHGPPNSAGDGYDWYNTNYRWSDCEDWNPDSHGELKNFSCEEYEDTFIDPSRPANLPGSCPNDGGTAFKVWWMQNIPGKDNVLFYQNDKVRNWWGFVGEYDSAIIEGENLLFECGTAAQNFCDFCYSKGGNISIGSANCWCAQNQTYINPFVDNCSMQCGQDCDHDNISNSIDECLFTRWNDTINIYGCTLPNATRFSGNMTSNLTGTSLFNVQNFSVGILSYGSILFLENITDLVGKNLNLYINISNNSVEIDSANIPELNVSARITLYSINFTNPVILRDGIQCLDCAIVNYTNNTLVFNVSHFTEYSAAETSDADSDGHDVTVDCNDTNLSVWHNLTGYIDSDHDSFGSGSVLSVCSGTYLPSGYSNLSTDCNNTNSSIHPGASDICGNGIDEDCSGSDASCGGGGSGGGGGGGGGGTKVKQEAAPVLVRPPLQPYVPEPQEQPSSEPESQPSVPSSEAEPATEESSSIPTAGMAYLQDTAGNFSLSAFIDKVRGDLGKSFIGIPAMLIILIIIISIILVNYFVLKGKKVMTSKVIQPNVNSAQYNHPLHDVRKMRKFIKQSLKAGHSEESIRNALLDAGWDRDDIELILKSERKDIFC